MHLDERCPNCAGHTDWNVPLYTVRIAESWSEQHDVYHWTRRGKASSCLRREGRTDYWEGLVHFCSPREFISIYRDRQISAASTGAYGRRAGSSGKTNAVCLTETTEENWDEIKALHGEYGFVFRKKDLIAIGGAPAIYLPDEVFEKMRLRREEVPETLWPYLNKLKIGKSAAGKPYDFLHEREWRVPQNIDFDQTPPYAVVFSPAPPNLPNEELILKAATEFQELSEFGMEDEEEPQSENEPRHEF